MSAANSPGHAQLSCSVPALKTNDFHPHNNKSRDSSDSCDAMTQKHALLPASPVLVAVLLSYVL